ncbi:hypothetical protein BS47DRAFT_1294280 [Hydnum rufescens UP504]|uniref:Oxysterol-binding protein n=1 Tax=Hydnum rufescens UP504 TaxID=1448309 RepID=A0A9P6B085_9AGAM|nr:hypothetical protein BS47DRAFT_1294280 [Hydnum rufescens UP504]
MADSSALPPPPSDDDVVPDPLIQDAPISLSESTDGSEGGKLKMIVQLVKRCLGVKDIAALRISLPASLLEPIPNLEYWTYLDRPDLFAAINDSTDPFERLLAVLRFSFSKDLKFIHGKIVKPYNSVLGEHFRAHWTVKPVSYPSDPTEPPIVHSHFRSPSSSTSTPSESASVKSSGSKKSWAGRTQNGIVNGDDSGAVDLRSALAADTSKTSLAKSSVTGPEALRVVFITEQVSHHPPISSFHCAVPEKGIQASGVDQISAKISGTSVRVQPGDANKGIFIKLTSGPGAGESYQITHPVATVNGLLRGSPYATICESTIITCTSPRAKQHLRVIIEYKDEAWIGRAQYLVEGVIHQYDPGNDGHKEWTRVKHVPSTHIIAMFEGSWRTRIYWRRVGEAVRVDKSPVFERCRRQMLIDLSTLAVVPKTVRPLDQQDAFESRKLWEAVTSNLLRRNFGEATKKKQIIEQAQRDRAAERKQKGIEFKPVYFHADISTGAPRLSDAGRKAIEAEFASQP